MYTLSDMYIFLPDGLKCSQHRLPTPKPPTLLSSTLLWLPSENMFTSVVDIVIDAILYANATYNVSWSGEIIKSLIEVNPACTQKPCRLVEGLPPANVMTF